nr:unnamed protein product [Callosobruchus analis]
MHVAKKKNGGNEPQVHGTQPERALFICYICNYTSSVKSRLIKHIGFGNCNLKAHSAESRLTFTRQNLSNDYVCAQCNIAFRTKRNLDGHIIKLHRESIESVSSKIHECKDCDYKTNRKYHFNRHMLTHVVDKEHPNSSALASIKIHQCPSCDYKSVRKYNIKNHTPVCTQGSAAKKKNGGKEPQVAVAERERTLFVCYICNYTSSTKTRLIQHIGVGNCNLKATSAKSRLAYTRQNPSNDYVCAQCNIAFRTKRNLDGHIIKLHKESVESVSSKIYECKNCDYKTNRKNNF